MIDVPLIRAFITLAADWYEKSAPTVTAWLNDLYARINSEPDKVTLSEILALAGLSQHDGWEQPNYAANRIYKLQRRLVRDTTGHAGF